ncbi:MAG TPA: hypothetical protein VJJ78_00950 [Candidatus Saccharimonadales bacterium]|nr:hypothetical protein [Candidatus Saccharimonadales bacterium]
MTEKLPEVTMPDQCRECPIVSTLVKLAEHSAERSEFEEIVGEHPELAREFSERFEITSNQLIQHARLARVRECIGPFVQGSSIMCPIKNTSLGNI